MASRCVWFLSAMSTLCSLSFATTLSTNECALEKTIFAMTMCPVSTCRDKCNKTLKEMRSSVPLQPCKCDEECVMFDDCCRDFASVCPETYRAGTEKYPQFYTECLSNVTLVFGKKPTQLWTSSMKPISFDEPLTPFAAPFAEDSRTLSAPKWVGSLLQILTLKVDEMHGLVMLSSQFWKDIQYPETNTNTFSRIKGAEAYLEIKKPLKRIEGLGDRVFNSKILYNIPFTTPVRSCLKHDFVCLKCQSRMPLEDLCHSETSEATLNNTILKLNIGNDSKTNCYAPDRTFPTSSEHEDLEKITVVPGPRDGMARFYSEDLPWSRAQCWLALQPKCVIESCAAERVLSSDGKACFIPTHVSISIVQPIDFVNSSFTLDGNKQFNSSFEIVPAPPVLCFNVFEIFKAHTKWNLKRLSDHRRCLIRIQYYPYSNVHGKEPEAKPVGNANQNSSGTEKDISILKSFQHQVIDSQLMDDKLTKMDNGRNSSMGRRKITEKPEVPLGSTDFDPYGMLQAWELIRHHLQVHPDTEQTRTLVLCLECPSDQRCLETESMEACRYRSSTCSSFEFPRACARNTRSKIRDVGLLALVLIVHLGVNIEL